MKKILSLLAIVALSAPVMAQSVTVTATTNANCGEVVIGYTSDGVAADELPVGIALKVTATDGNITGLKADYDKTEFPVYLDYAYSEEVDGDGFTDEPWEGHPLAASESLPGALTVTGEAITPTDMVVVCMGRLVDPPSAGPASMDNLVTLIVDDGATVSVALESTYRGGIVSAKAGTTLNVVLPQDVTVTCDNGPCLGDIDEDGYVTSFDLDALLASLVATAPNYYYQTPATNKGIASDIDEDGYVTSFDLDALLAKLVATAPNYYYACD